MSDGSQARPSPASQLGLFLQGQRRRGGEGEGEEVKEREKEEERRKGIRKGGKEKESAHFEEEGRFLFQVIVLFPLLPLV